MTATPPEPSPTDPPAAPTPPANLPETPAPPWGEDFSPEKAWKAIQDLRGDLKAARADRTPQDEKDAKVIASLKRQLETAQSPEDVKKEMAQAIAKTLGLVEDEAIDPAKLTESLTAAQQQAKQAQVALAVFQNAGTVGDPRALLDSTSFLRSLEAIDPSDDAAVTAAITSAVEANPRLGAAPGEPRTPARNPAQGASAGGSPSLEAQIDAATKAGDIDQAIHLQNQKLALLQRG